MPTYDYFCTTCKHELEIIQKITEQALTTCPACNSQTLARRPGKVGLAFSGDGFYATMYGQNKGSDSASPSPAPCCPCGKGASACSSKKG